MTDNETRKAALDRYVMLKRIQLAKDKDAALETELSVAELELAPYNIDFTEFETSLAKKEG